VLPAIALIFLAITAAGSSRNYGLRYVLPLAPLGIVWVSGLAEGGRRAHAIAAIGVLGQALAVASVHPYELSYFNGVAGGPVGGRHVLADSNLDWGQGLKALQRLQRDHPEFNDLTLYYFGDTDPRHYGVKGACHVIDAGSVHPGLPPRLAARTRYVAVSASLQWGPWGPADYFRSLDVVPPERFTEDATIAIYRWPPGGPKSIKVAPAREPVLEHVGSLGHAADESGHVEVGDRKGDQVVDDDEVFLTPQHLDREVALDAPRIELQQDSRIALVGRPADRDEREDRAAFGIGSGVPGIDRLAAVELQGNDDPPAVSPGRRVESRSDREVADDAVDVRVGRLWGLVRTKRIGAGP
jgi:hypothetical protein